MGKDVSKENLFLLDIVDTTTDEKDEYIPEENLFILDADDMVMDEETECVPDEDLFVLDFLIDGKNSQSVETNRTEKGHENGAEKERPIQLVTNHKSKKNNKKYMANKITHFEKGKLLAMVAITAVVFGMVGCALFGQGNAVKQENQNSVITEIKTGEGNIPAVVNKVKNSVVTIDTIITVQTETGETTKKGGGSGIIISTDGYIVTNNHVIEDSKYTTAILSNGSAMEATLIGSDNATDIAVLKINTADLESVELGESKNLAVGQTIITVGNPLGLLGGTVTSGIISSTSRDVTIDGQTMNLLQMSAPINSGNSGGGLFDLDGKLVGIINAKRAGAGVEGLGFAIPIDNAKEVVAQLISEGKVSGRPQLGVQIAEVINYNEAYKYSNDEVFSYIDSAGLYVASSTNDTLRIGDKILAIEEKTISTMEGLRLLINTRKVGDKINVLVSRNNKVETVVVILTEK